MSMAQTTRVLGFSLLGLSLLACGDDGGGTIYGTAGDEIDGDADQGDQDGDQGDQDGDQGDQDGDQGDQGDQGDSSSDDAGDMGDAEESSSTTGPLLDVFGSFTN